MAAGTDYDWLGDDEEGTPDPKSGVAKKSGAGAPDCEVAAGAAPRRKRGGRKERVGGSDKSLAAQVIDGVAESHPEGVQGWVRELAADPDMKRTAATLLNKAMSTPDAGVTEIIRSVSIRQGGVPMELIDVTPEGLRDATSRLKRAVMNERGEDD